MDFDIYDIIRKKRDGGELTEEEIRYFVSRYTDGHIPDPQAAALLMAICINGMTPEETTALTLAMTYSGDVMDLSSVNGPTADKHSTGGVGDKTTLVAAPVAAACGVKVAKMTGRGLGHTGGTVDKLESIPGFLTELPPDVFLAQVNKIGLSIIGQTGRLTPADKKLYSLRNSTGTVESIPLIASSIMSKKFAGGSQSIVLDVKYGSGAFMKTPKAALELAETMVAIGRRENRRMTAVVSNMDTPLGNCIGNNLEVIEAIEILNDRGPADLREICLTLSALMVSSALEIPYDDAFAKAEQTLKDGSALGKLRDMVKAQLGDSTLIDYPERFASCRFLHEVRASEEGYISSMNSEKIGAASMLLGAGRRFPDDAIDFSAGIVLKKKTGDKVDIGEPIASLHSSRDKTLHEAENLLNEAITYSKKAPPKEKHIYNIIHE